MGTMTFVNLSVKDLGKATEFFSEVGFACDPQFTDETATRMIMGSSTSTGTSERSSTRTCPRARSSSDRVHP